MIIRALAPHESDLLREVRLRALSDAPDSFGETLAEAAARPRSHWENQTRLLTEPDGHVMFMACDGEMIHGSVYGLIDRDRLGAGRVGGMWVDPSRRREGMGFALLLAVIDWADSRGMARLGLWAPVHRLGAIALYTRAGFRATGLRKPLPSDPSYRIQEMEYILPSRSPLT